MKYDFDLIIVGGGVVGAALACALKDSELSIALLDAQAPVPFDASAELDLRVFALSMASRRILQAVGAWEAVAAARISPYREMHVWDARGAGSIHFDSAALGEPELGCIVENRLLQHALWAQLKGNRRVTLLYPAKPEALELTDDGAALAVSGGRRRLRHPGDGGHRRR